VARSSGLLDTNVVIHAIANDGRTAECRAMLDELAAGRISAVLDPLVVHELSYGIPRYRKTQSKSQVAQVLLWLIGLDGIECEKDLLRDAIDRWAANPGLGFVDAWLAARAARAGVPVYTKNVKHFAGQGVAVPDPLPGAAST
jgi:predicted nucleic acid-binding protein